MSKRIFTAFLRRPKGVGTWTYLDIPFDVEKEFGSKGRVKVKGKINGHAYRGSAMPHGNGKHFLVVKQEIRDAIGATRGSMVTVQITADKEVREVTVPAELLRVFKKDKKAAAVFAKLSYSHKKEYVEWIESAKKEDTRKRRVGKAVEMLAKGLTQKG